MYTVPIQLKLQNSVRYCQTILWCPLFSLVFRFRVLSKSVHYQHLPPLLSLLLRQLRPRTTETEHGICPGDAPRQHRLRPLPARPVHHRGVLPRRYAMECRRPTRWPHSVYCIHENDYRPKFRHTLLHVLLPFWELHPARPTERRVDALMRRAALAAAPTPPRPIAARPRRTNLRGRRCGRSRRRRRDGRRRR